MSRTVIEINNLSKQYRLGQVGATTIADDFKRLLYKMRGKEDPFLKVGEENDRTKKSNDKYVWALKDINFKVEQGDVLGIIGKNGAGKSTLLKILSRTTTPTLGEYKIKGRVASLLEVGTGFHPDLTGRENVFLNGAILGMTKAEIKKQFDAIVDFSGVERYIDTPVKRYSSGMYVRLAFAVAAHLESEILIVDEVLAVGDIEFQNKCLGKMKDVSGKGRTVLFVSHSIPSIKTLCTKSLVMQNGKTIFHGPVAQGIDIYMRNGMDLDAGSVIPDSAHTYNTGEAKFHSLELVNTENDPVNEVLFNEKIKFRINLDVFQKIENALLDLKINSNEAITITHSMNMMDGAGTFTFNPGRHVIELELENNFQPGNYNINLGIHRSDKGTATIDYVENIGYFNVSNIAKNNNDYNYDFVFGYVRPNAKWKILN